MTQVATIFVRDQDGLPTKIPVASFDPTIHQPSRACATVKVREKGDKAGEMYVINATDFDAKLHEKV